VAPSVINDTVKKHACSIKNKIILQVLKLYLHTSNKKLFAYQLKHTSF